jgi:hypothetical protein
MCMLELFTFNFSLLLFHHHNLHSPAQQKFTKNPISELRQFSSSIVLGPNCDNGKGATFLALFP